MYPLRFEPLFRRYIWGGTRLGAMLHKQTGDKTCAESWEIVDHGSDQSVVKYGSLAGKTLHQLVQDHGTELLGRTWTERINDVLLPDKLHGRFPLLLKFLDANRNLSVQVHPDNEMAAKLDPPDLGKTEAWYVIHADPGSKIYAGLKPGITKEQLRAAIEDGTAEQLLHSFEPQVGDCVFIRAGTLHAIGAGLLIAEIQQASDTTFRIFDWNRVDVDGKPRELHIEQSLTATDFDLGPIKPVDPILTNHDAKLIVSSDKFMMRKWNLSEPLEVADQELHVLAVTRGRVSVSGDPSAEQMQIGDTMMVPAACNNIVITPHEPAELLDITLPA